MSGVVTSSAICTECKVEIEASTLNELSQACFDHVTKHTNRPALRLFPYFTGYYKLSKGVTIGVFLWPGGTVTGFNVPRQNAGDVPEQAGGNATT